MTYPGNPAHHGDDAKHNKFIESTIDITPGSYRMAVFLFTKDQTDWLAHFVALRKLLPMLWLQADYSPNDCQHKYSGYATMSNGRRSKHAIALVQTFIKSLRW